MVEAGKCTGCREEIWRRAVHAKTGQSFLLYPDPESVYIVAETALGYAPGIGYCRKCAPLMGESMPEGITVSATINGSATVSPTTRVIDVVPASQRYGAWYEQTFGEWLRAWLKDHLELPEVAVDNTCALWQRDRERARPVHG